MEGFLLGWARIKSTPLEFKKPAGMRTLGGGDKGRRCLHLGSRNFY